MLKAIAEYAKHDRAEFVRVVQEAQSSQQTAEVKKQRIRPVSYTHLDVYKRQPEHCGGDRWSILHGDSLQIIRQFEPNSFDAIITDPPYASGGSSQTTKNRSTNEKYRCV